MFINDRKYRVVSLLTEKEKHVQQLLAWKCGQTVSSFHPALWPKKKFGLASAPMPFRRGLLRAGQSSGARGEQYVCQG